MEEFIAAFEWVPVQNDSDIPVRFDYTYTDEVGNEVSENVEVNGCVEYYDAMTFTKTEKVICDGTDFITISGNDDYYSGGNNATVQIVDTGVSDNSQMLIEGTAWQIPEDKYSDAAVYSQSAIGQMQRDVAEVFCVTSKTTYYMLKITTQTDAGDIVTHLPFGITVIPGKVSLRAYQMNVNTAEGSVSEFNPSFRVASRAPKIMTGSDGRLHAVVEFDSSTLYNGEKNGVELLRLLNEALSAECTTLGEWIRTNVEEGKGFYPLIEWNTYNSLVQQIKNKELK